MDLEGAFLVLEGALFHSLPKSGRAMAPLAPPVPTSLDAHDASCNQIYNSQQKSWDTLHFFALHLTFIPLLPPNNVIFVRSACGNGKISRAQRCLVSHRLNNIVLGGVVVAHFYKCPKYFWRLLYVLALSRSAHIF